MATKYDGTIDVITTATIRPDLLERTLHSFSRLLAQHDRWRLLLNVDPIGRKDKTRRDVVDVAKQYFDEIVLNLPKEPSFPAAWFWCVEQVENEFVLWLEDDWELLLPVDLIEMIAIMRENEDLASLRLPRWEAAERTFRQWNRKKLVGWNGRFMEIPEDHRRSCGYSNNPSLTRRDFLKPMLPHFHGPTDPEKQIAGFNLVLRPWVAYWRYGVYQAPEGPIAVRDIGEEWRKANSWGKGKNKVQFKTWEHHDYGR